MDWIYFLGTWAANLGAVLVILGALFVVFLIWAAISTTLEHLGMDENGAGFLACAIVCMLAITGTCSYFHVQSNPRPRPPAEAVQK